MILTGLTYEEILAGQPLVNSALWVIPEWSDAYGLQIKTRRQGKVHLAPNEQAFNGGGAHVLQGFRPCQWLIGYPWSSAEGTRPVGGEFVRIRSIARSSCRGSRNHPRSSREGVREMCC